MPETKRPNAPPEGANDGLVDAASVSDSHRRLWLPKHDGRPEIRSRSRRVARVAAWVTAGLVVVGIASWLSGSIKLLLDPCAERVVPAGVECQAMNPVMRAIQMVIAVPGMVMGVVGVVYLVHFAVTGQTFRRWRGVAVVFGSLVAAWLAVYLVGWIWLVLDGR